MFTTMLGASILWTTWLINMKPIKNKSKHILLIEEEHHLQIEELLRRLYVDEGLSIQELATRINVTYLTAHRWLKKAGIYSHKLSL